MVEHPAVNRAAVGSSPTTSANFSVVSFVFRVTLE